MGFVGLPTLSAYNVSKAALDAFSESLAAEVAPLGVCVHLIIPGFFPTNFLATSNDATDIAQAQLLFSSLLSFLCSCSCLLPRPPYLCTWAISQLWCMHGWLVRDVINLSFSLASAKLGLGDLPTMTNRIQYTHMLVNPQPSLLLLFLLGLLPLHLYQDPL